MAKPRTKRAKDEQEGATSLVAALKFISIAQKDIGSPYQCHSILSNKWAVAFDGVLALGHPIDEELNACPHTLRLIDALAKCGDSLAVTQTDAERLAIKSGAFRAFVPCVGLQSMPNAAPDQPSAVIDDRLRTALEVVGGLASDNAQHVVTASILLRAGSAVATDRIFALEYWHGIDLPPGIVLPKAAAAAVCKIAKPLAKFGFSNTTVTFWFADGSWLRSQLYSEPWPNIDRVLNVKCNPWPVPEKLAEALDAVAPFSGDGNVRFTANLLRSHDVDGLGATFEVTGLPYGPKFNAKKLKILLQHAKVVDFAMPSGIAYFFGENVRGVLAGIKA